MANELSKLIRDSKFYFIATGQRPPDGRNLTVGDAIKIFDFIADELKIENLRRDGQNSSQHVQKRANFLIAARKQLISKGFRDKQRNLQDIERWQRHST